MARNFETTELTLVFSSIYIFHSVLTDHEKLRNVITFQELSGHFERCKSLVSEIF